MLCYYGDSSDVVGICLACGRALCREHAAEIGDRLACKGRHEKEVGSLKRAASLALEGTKIAIGLLLVAGLALRRPLP